LKSEETTTGWRPKEEETSHGLGKNSEGKKMKEGAAVKGWKERKIRHGLLRGEERDELMRVEKST
jgi:hypothetical protein